MMTRTRAVLSAFILAGLVVTPIWAQLGNPQSSNPWLNPVPPGSAAVDPRVTALRLPYSWFRTRIPDKAASDRLAAGAVESNRSNYYDLMDLYDSLEKLFPLLDRESLAILTMGAAVSRRSAVQLQMLFTEMLQIMKNTRPKLRGTAELAAAAAISGKSAKDVVDIFHGHWKLGTAGLDETDTAILAAGSVRSGRPPLELQAIYGRLPTNVPRAHLAAGIAITGRLPSEHIDLYAQICAALTPNIGYEPGPTDEACAMMATAVLAAEHGSVVVPDYSRQLSHPVLPAKAGEGTTAEDAFKFNWFGL